MYKKRIFVLYVAGIMLAAVLANVSIGDLGRGLPDNADSEPNGTIADATNITSDSISIPGTMDGSDNADVYKIWLENVGGNAETVTIYTDFNTTQGVSIEVTDSSGFQYYIGFDANADEKTVKVISGLTQHFYINLSTQMIDASYDLTITVSSSAFTGNSNNDPSQAPTVTGDNQPIIQSLDGDTPGDHHDFYKIALSGSAATSDLLVVYLDQPGTADFWLQLYKAEGGGVYTMVKQAKGIPAGTDFVMSRGTGTTESGDYYIRVYAWSGTGQYTIYIQKTAIDTDNNNAYGDATGISMVNDHTWSTSDTVGESIDPEDWFSLDIIKGQFINVTITSDDYDGTTGLPKIFVSLLRADHFTEFSDPNLTDAQIDPVGYSNGTSTEASAVNYIKVYVIGGGGGGGYSLDLLTDRPPQVNGALVGTVPILENTVDTSIDLSAVFTDPDASDDLVFSYEKGVGTVGFEDDNNLTISIGGNGVVTITPKAGIPEGWTGSGGVTFKAVDPFGLEVIGEFTIDVKGANHEPYVKGPFNVTYSFPETILLTYEEEEVNSTLNLKDVFADNDTGDILKFDVNTDNVLWIDKDEPEFGGVKVLQGVTINSSIRIAFSLETNYIDHKGPISARITDSAKVDKLDHDAVVYFHAIDNGEPSMESTTVKLVISIRSPGGNEPEWKSGFTKVQFDEDNSSIVDLDSHVIDIDPVDGGALQYDIFDLGDNITAEKSDRSTVTFSAPENWNGEVTGVRIMATDTYGLTANTTIKVVVNPVADAPVEDPLLTNPAAGGMNIAVVSEDGEKNFTVGATDADGEGTAIIYEWYLDDELITTAVDSTYTYKPGFDDAGTHKITVKVKDGDDPTTGFNVTWTVQVGNINRLPTNVKIESPEHNTSYKQGAKIQFNAALATDPDDDPLTYTWYMDGAPMPGGDNRTFIYKKLKPGQHIIKLDVSDGNGGVVSDEVTIKVKKKQEQPGFEAVLLMLALVAVVLLAQRKRR